MAEIVGYGTGLDELRSEVSKAREVPADDQLRQELEKRREQARVECSHAQEKANRWKRVVIACSAALDSMDERARAGGRG